MLAEPVRRFLDPYLDRAAALALRRRVSANTVTFTGFGFGLLALPFLAAGYYVVALLFICLNRFCDGLDGAIARRSTPTALGAFLDVILDYTFFAAVLFAFALSRAESAYAAAFFLFGLIVSAVSLLARAVFAEKHRLVAEAHENRSLRYLSGLVEGPETFLAFGVMCLIPDAFAIICYLYGVMCFVAAGARIASVVAELGETEKQ